MFAFTEDVMSFLSKMGLDSQLKSGGGCQRVASKCGIHFPSSYLWAMDMATERLWFQHLDGSHSNIWLEIHRSTLYWHRALHDFVLHTSHGCCQCDLLSINACNAARSTDPLVSPSASMSLVSAQTMACNTWPSSNSLMYCT